MTSTMPAQFDVFVSYHHADRPAVEMIARRLRQERLEPWWDGWRLVPGEPWQEAIVHGLRASKAFAVVVGPSGLGDWVREELAIAQDRAAKERGFRMFMVLLPGAPDLSDPSFDILRTRGWVDLRAGTDREEGLQELLAAITGAPRGRDEAVGALGICPYRGLEPFAEDDADLFFGRERDVARITEKLKAGRFLAVLGPSGSGKTSLIRAGCIPSLRRGDVPGSAAWTIRVFTPGARPIVTLAVQLARVFPTGAVQETADRLGQDARTLDFATSLGLADSPPEDRVVLVVDQFEELFTLCTEDDRRAFLDNLLYAATVPGGRTVVVMGMRADFYQRCAPYPVLRDLVADRQYLVGPLDAEGMRQAVEQPAAGVGLELEAGLTDTILGGILDRPGALPLLEHVLLELWERRRGAMLTLGAYAATGGVAGALERRAEATYARLTEAQQGIARRVLLRLVQPGEGSEDTRRRAELRELATGPHDEEDVEAVVRALADQRLLSVGRDDVSGARVVELTHEALIRGWPQLRAWIDEDRDALQAQRRLTEATAEWDRSGRADEGLLYRGARLAAWREWDTGVLPEAERAFLAASVQCERDELEAARRRTRRFRQLSRMLAVLLVLAVVGGAVAVRQGREAADQRQLARSAQLSTQATALGESRPDLTALLSVEAFRAAPTEQARRSLTSLSALPEFGGSLAGHTEPLTDVAVGADGLVATASQDRTVSLWDVDDGARVGVLVEHTDDVDTIAFSADGRLLASAGKDRKVVLWDVERRSRLAVLAGHNGEVTTVAFSADGRMLASGDNRGDLILWDVERRDQVATMGDTHSGEVAFSPDGRLLAVSDLGLGPVLLDVATRQRVADLGTVEKPGAESLAFSADSGQLAALSGGTLTLWDVGSRAVSRELSVAQCCAAMAFSSRGRLATAHSGEVVIWDSATGGEISREPLDESYSVEALAFSPDGRRLAAVTAGTLKVWSAGAPGPQTLAGAGIFTGALAPDGRLLATAGEFGTIRLWDVARRVPVGRLEVEDRDVLSLAFSPRGQFLAAGGRRGTIWWWDTGTREMRAESTPEGVRNVLSLLFSPDGRLLAAADQVGMIALWDVETRTVVGRLDPGPITEGRPDPVKTSMAFTPDGGTLFSGNDDGNRIRVWDVGSRALTDTLEANRGWVGAVAMRPDGRVLASGGEDGTIILWDVARRARVAPLVGHGDGVIGLAFSPDGNALASGAFDDELFIWNSATRRQLATASIGFPAQTVTFAEGGVAVVAVTGLFTGGAVVDQVRVLDLDAGRVMKRICDSLRHSLTREEWAANVPGQPYRQTCGRSPS